MKRLSLGRRSTSAASAHSGETVAPELIYQAAAICLSYPDEAVMAGLPVISTALADSWAEPLFAPVLSHLGAGPLSQVQSFHIAEFDLSRRHSLHLTYWTHGDTRRRGEVLAQIKARYRESGLIVDLRGELPDFLPLALEFAVADPQRGGALLADYRASVELLRLGLEEDGLPHAGVLQAVCRTLPGPSPRNRQEAQALSTATAPTTTDGMAPVELVGLDAAGPSTSGYRLPPRAAGALLLEPPAVRVAEPPADPRLSGS